MSKKMSEKTKLIYPESLKVTVNETESNENWGFADTNFAVNKRGNVTIEGNRYELSGKELPTFPVGRSIWESNDTKDVNKVRIRA